MHISCQSTSFMAVSNELRPLLYAMENTLFIDCNADQQTNRIGYSFIFNEDKW